MRNKLLQKSMHPSWEQVNLGSLLLSKPSYGINAAAVPFAETLPKYLRITDISEDGKLLKQNQCSVDNINSGNYYLKKGDMVFARTGASVGKTYLYNEEDGKLVFAGFLIKVRTDTSKLIPTFLFQFTKTRKYFSWVKETSPRSGQPGINGEEYASLKFPLPPLPEQQRIVSVLETWDQAIEKLTQKIEKKKNIKKGLMQELLTGERRLPGFTEKWETVEMEDVCAISMGQSPSSLAYNENGTGIPLIQGNNDIKNRKTIARIWTTEITKTAKVGDIIMTVRAPVGLIGVATADVCIGRGVCAIRAISAEQNFILKFLENFENKWRAFEQGSTFTAVNSTDVKSLLINLPTSRNEQTAIANILTAADKEIQALEKKLRLFKEQKNYLLNNLITGAIRTPESLKSNT